MTLTLPSCLDRDSGRHFIDIVKPAPDLSPSEFAAEYRILHPIYCAERPGRWSNEVFPHHPHVMDMVQEAVRLGKEGVVWMKAGQVAGTDAAINCMMWLKVHLPGPQLFLTSTDAQATKFGMERFRNVINDMPPLRVKRLKEAREPALMHRFTDGTIDLCGGQSIFKLQSNPYRVVGIDELDSLVENLGGEGDPIELAKIRTDSFTGQTLMLAYAHPTTKDRGAGKLFYEQSDQRRPFVQHDCGEWFYFQQEHFKCTGADKSDWRSWEYVCPACGAVIHEHDRMAMIRRMEYRSVLPLEVARDRPWIGAQFGQLISPHKPLSSFVKRRLQCGDDANKIRVYVNKVLGETYDAATQKINVSQLRSLIVVKRRANDPEFFSRGQVPAGVRFLTAGQDSRTVELHYSVWGWGLRRAIDKTVSLCGWLIDWGVIKREYSIQFSESEYHVFDDLIYRRIYMSADGQRRFNVRQCGHDVGYPPTQIPIHSYCRHWRDRAMPMKGASLEASSATNAPYARRGTPMKFKASGVEVVDEGALIVNTFMLKTDLFGWMDPSKRIEVLDPVSGPRLVNRLSLPEDVDDVWIEQSKNEELVSGKKTGELIWRKTGPNHFADCNTYALGCAYNLDPFQQGLTSDEYAAKRGIVQRGSVNVREAAHDPAMG